MPWWTTRGENNSFLGYSQGTLRRSCWFYFHLGGKATDQTSTTILCKSPIDAISFAMLEYQIRGGIPPARTVYMAIDDLKSLPVDQLRNIPHIVVAFDKDKTIDGAAQRVLELLPHSKQVQPSSGDWNQELIEYDRQLRRQQQQQQDDELSL